MLKTVKNIVQKLAGSKKDRESRKDLGFVEPHIITEGHIFLVVILLAIYCCFAICTDDTDADIKELKASLKANK